MEKIKILFGLLLLGCLTIILLVSTGVISIQPVLDKLSSLTSTKHTEQTAAADSTSPETTPPPQNPASESELPLDLQTKSTTTLPSTPPPTPSALPTVPTDYTVPVVAKETNMITATKFEPLPALPPAIQFEPLPALPPAIQFEPLPPTSQLPAPPAIKIEPVQVLLPEPTSMTQLPAPEPQPNYSTRFSSVITNGVSGPNNFAGGAFNYLDRLGVTCKTGGISGLALSKASDTTMKYDFDCSSVFDNGNAIPLTYEDKKTPWVRNGDFGGSGDGRTYSDMPVDCGTNKFLTYFGLSSDYVNKTWGQKFRCAAPTGNTKTLKCLDMQTPWENSMKRADGYFSTEGLMKHKIKCDIPGTALNRIKLVYSADGSMTSYEYRCCDMN